MPSWPSRSNPPSGFLNKVVRLADRWRALEPKSETACNTTANILRTLGQPDLSWDYMTTPIGMQPNEAEPWLNLAGSLQLTDHGHGR